MKKEGVATVEYKNWRSHNRNHKGAWGPVNGVIIHHTVTRGTDTTLGIVYDGYSELPGPLCHAMGAKDGTIYLISNGRANHAGKGDRGVLDAVMAEQNSPQPTSNNTDGNSHFYGIELENLGDGKDPWPRAQYEAAVRWAAALCRHHGWNEKSVIGHKEWQIGKIDPSFSMAAFRQDVAKVLAGKPIGGGSNESDSGGSSGGGAAPSRKRVTIDGLAYGYGAQGAHVTAVGKALVAQGCSAYTSGPGPTWTDADTRSFQKWQHKLGDAAVYCDGVPGPKQLRGLLAASFPTGIAPGREDPTAKHLQIVLKAAGWLDTSVQIVDTYGPQSQAAVAAFNKKYGLNSADKPDDPSIGPKGWKKLFQLAYGL
ncbi:N-acetylmuramoyl-L-alanine amidase [Streptomyces sp. x-80]|uniref:N-acetylmuramoyl-L-alanine amidase n=1 Tax=Streptomyces sp. x-80 TaxID=2789282 RepID=UPI00397EDFB9